jgi:hypothetical protein
MKRLVLGVLFAGLITIGVLATAGGTRAAMQATSGNGKYRFRVLYTSSHLPSEAQAVLKGAHGGFAVDLRPGKGETYFSLKGAGIIQISADLKSTRMVTTAPEMKDTNLHNTTVWYATDGTPYLVFPGNESQRVFTTRLDGSLVHTLAPPAPGTDLGAPRSNGLFPWSGQFHSHRRGVSGWSLLCGHRLLEPRLCSDRPRKPRRTPASRVERHGVRWQRHWTGTVWHRSRDYGSSRQEAD